MNETRFRMPLRALVCLLLCVVCSWAAPSASASTSAPSFKKGVSIAHWMAKVYHPDGPGALWFNESDVKWIAAQGFDHIRFPVDGRYIENADGTVNEERLYPFLRALEWTREAGLAAVFDMHFLPGGKYDKDHQDPAVFTDAKARAHAALFWRNLAARLKNYGPELRFELVNEPNAPTAESLNETHAALIAAIREVDADRILYISPVLCGDFSQLEKLAIPADPKVAILVLYDEPSIFTHQKASWKGCPPDMADVVFPGKVPDFTKQFPPDHFAYKASNKEISAADIDADFARANAWIQKNAPGREVYLGVFGVYEKAHDESRTNYIAAVSQAASKLGWGWCVWSYNGWFAVRTEDTGKGTAVLRGLFGDAVMGNAVFNTMQWHGGVDNFGQQVILDGFSGYGISPSAPARSDAFTVESWVMLGAYPWHPAPILAEAKGENAAFALSIDAHGRAQWSVGNDTVTARDTLPLRTWHHVVGVVSQGRAELFVNGVSAGSAKLSGALPPAVGNQLVIGKSPKARIADGALRPEANAVVSSFLDGAIDHLAILPKALSSAEIVAAHKQGAQEFRGAPIGKRVLPAGPAKTPTFGAFPTKLSYYSEWDRSWRSAGSPDVVVSFGDQPGRFVFWRGTSFIPHWVTENGIWFTNEFNETWGEIKGCGEPMSDKQTRYSRVAILENGPARAVVQWRYALTDVFYEIARANPDTGWGDWSDEIYTIYPDGTAVRSVTLHTSRPDAPHEWHEAIVVMGPGMTPDNSIEPTALSVLKADGTRHDISWAKETPPYDPGAAQGASIHLVNTKSRLKPFTIVRPQDKPSFNIFSKEVRRDVSIFPWWNHWPSSLNASDGRYAFAADRASHSSLSNIAWEPLRKQGLSETKVQLNGLTDQPIEALLPVMKAWATPASVEASEGNRSLDTRFLPEEKAFVVQRPASAPASPVTLRFAASADSPLSNPCVVIENWGANGVGLALNGKALTYGKDFKAHTRPGLERIDLVVWLPLSATQSTELTFTALSH